MTQTESHAVSDAAQHYHVFETAMGFCAIAWSEAGIVALQLPERDHARTRARLLRRWPQAREAPPSPAVRDAIDNVVALTSGVAAEQAGAELAALTLDLEELPAFEIGDACALPYASGQFAGAAAHLVLIFIPKPEMALRELRRVTRPGGTVAAALWDFRGGLVFERMLWDVAVGIDPQARVVRDLRFTAPLALPDGLPQLFRDEGLTQVECRSLTVRTDYADFDDYWQPLLGGQGPVGSYFANLAPDLEARIKAAVFDAYCSGAPDGPRSLTATAWAVRGKVP